MNQKKDHCDHKLSEGTIMVITMTDENEDFDDFLCKEWQAVVLKCIKVDEMGEIGNIL